MHHDENHFVLPRTWFYWGCLAVIFPLLINHFCLPWRGGGVNSMLVMEARSLAFMARALGVDAESWETDYLHRSALIREAFWDESTGFFYNADKADNDFSYRLPNDLKRREISSFLPLWAGIADSVTAKRVMETYLLGGM